MTKPFIHSMNGYSTEWREETRDHVFRDPYGKVLGSIGEDAPFAIAVLEAFNERDYYKERYKALKLLLDEANRILGGC